jgi:glycosyltransferase involved in cell wall biosynthesis
VLKKVLRQAFMRASCQPWHLAGAVGLYRGPRAPVQFVIESADWAIRRVGEHIRDEIEVILPGMVQTTSSPQRIHNHVVHFGSQYMWLTWGHLLSCRNRFVTSFFHGKPEDGADVARHIDQFLASVPRLSTVVTGASIIEKRLLEWGVPRDKLVRIPIGVDTRLFVPSMSKQRIALRQLFGIPDGVVLVGSFQKDGLGWGDGMEPKLIKGPDIYVEAMRAMKAAGMPVMAFLTGPARGFVKQGLKKGGIPFAHHYVKSHKELVACYQLLDLYVVSSREEGGPMGLMEGMACGVPVVSTRVGMGPDLIVDGVTGGLVDSWNGEEIALKAHGLLALSPSELARLKQNALNAVKATDWSEVALSHWEKVYQPLIHS